MEDGSKPVRIGIEGVSYSLAHVPDLVRYGSKPLRELLADVAWTACEGDLDVVVCGMTPESSARFQFRNCLRAAPSLYRQYPTGKAERAAQALV